MPTTIRTRRVFTVVAAVSACLCSVNGHAKVAQTDIQSVQRSIATGMSSDRQIDIALVIKGGISLGAYESGVNWTLLRFLKNTGERQGIQVNLLASAGASAGAINGVMSAVYWCGDGSQPDTLADNFIRNTWRDIGIEGLLDQGRMGTIAEAKADNESGDPCKVDDDYTAFPLRPEDNAVLSRRVLRRTEKLFQCIMSQAVFAPGCQVAVGVTLTRANPLRVDNAGVEVKNQRLVAPLLLATGPDRSLSVKPFRLETDDEPLNRSVIYLDDPVSIDARGSDTLDVRTLFTAVKASASFPVAFAPIKLSYCTRIRTDPGAFPDNYGSVGLNTRCLANHRRLTSYFVDGGVFDNDPIGLVRHLAEAMVRERQHGTRDADADAIRFINIDPGRRRLPKGRNIITARPFNQPGDSIDVQMIAGEPVDTGPYDVAAADSVTLTALLCDSDGKQLTSVPLPLYETGPRTRRFVGALHTRPQDSEKPFEVRWTNDVLVTQPREQIRLFAPGEPLDLGCTSPDPKKKKQERTIEPYVATAVVADEPQGLSTQLGFVGGAIESGRGAKLYDEIVGEDWRDGLERGGDGGTMKRPLFQPARLTPLTGDFLVAFGAFLDQRFRDYDYYAGVYDALYGLAEFHCFRNEDYSDACLSQVFKTIYLSLCPECANAATPANVVLRQLVVLDVCGSGAVTGDGPACDLGESNWRWIDELVPAELVALTGDLDGCRLERKLYTEPVLDKRTPTATVQLNELAAVGRALICGQQTEELLDRDPFRAFVLQLEQDPRFTRPKATPIGRMLAKRDRPMPTWFYPLAKTTVSQLLPLEKRDQKIRQDNGNEVSGGSKLAKGALAFGGLATETIMADRSGWQWHLSSVPPRDKWSWLAPLLPNEVAVDTRNGGLAVYWEAGWRSRGPLGLSLRLAPYQRQRQGLETVEFAEVSAFALYKSTNPFISSYGVGPTVTYAWTEPTFGKRNTLGASAFVGLIGDKLRVTYGVRSFSRDEFEGDDIFWQLSLRDLPGFVYWGLRGF